MVVHGVSGSTPDELLRMGGTTGTHTESIGTATTTNKTGVYVGPDRVVSFRQLVGTITGAGATLTTNMQICSDAAGTGATTVASFPAVTASQITATGATAAFPKVVVRTTAALPYVRASHVSGGTPTITGLAIIAEPISASAP